MFKTWKVNHKTKNYHSQVHVSSKGKGLRVEKQQPISKENFEMVKKDQDLQQVIELKIEDTTCQKLDEEVKKKKVELIVDNDRNQKMVIVENVVENDNPQVSIDLLKMTTTQYVDFLGVENFNFITSPFLIDVVNKLKVDENKFYATHYEEFKFQNWIKSLKHSKYLFIWSGRFHISTINLRTSLFLVEGFNVGHDLIFNFCNYLILVFLCNFLFIYFRFRLFISFFLGVFKVI